jgi:large subunit ribosomal protein L10
VNPLPTKEKKHETVASLQASFNKAQMAIVADYRGLSVAEITDLRRRGQKAGGELTVSKNTLIDVATKGQDNWSALAPLLVGPTALVFAYEDLVAPAKALDEFAKEKRAVKIQVRGGVMQGKALNAKGVEAVAKLPSREVLLSQLLQVMNGPITGFVNVLAANPRGLVTVLDAIRKQKESLSA